MGFALSINESYFDKIDSPEKAYWLGFLYADGCILYDKNLLPRKVTFALKDKEPVENFRSAISSSHKLSYYSIFDKRTSKFYDRYGIQIYCSKFVSGIVQFGYKKKSDYSVAFPDIDESLYSHFIRGLFDGDGGFTKTFSLATIMASRGIIARIKNILSSIGVKYGKTYTKHSNVTGYLDFIKIYQIGNLLKFCDYIYNGSKKETRLERKYDLFTFKKKDLLSKVKFHKFKSPTGEVFETSNILNFSRENNLKSSRIHQLVRGEHKHHRGWRYVSE